MFGTGGYGGRYLRMYRIQVGGPTCLDAGNGELRVDSSMWQFFFLAEGEGTVWCWNETGCQRWGDAYGPTGTQLARAGDLSGPFQTSPYRVKANADLGPCQAPAISPWSRCISVTTWGCTK